MHPFSIVELDDYFEINLPNQMGSLPPSYNLDEFINKLENFPVGKRLLPLPSNYDLIKEHYPELCFVSWDSYRLRQSPDYTYLHLNVPINNLRSTLHSQAETNPKLFNQLRDSTVSPGGGVLFTLKLTLLDPSVKKYHADKLDIIPALNGYIFFLSLLSTPQTDNTISHTFWDGF